MNKLAKQNEGRSTDHLPTRRIFFPVLFAVRFTEPRTNPFEVCARRDRTNSSVRGKPQRITRSKAEIEKEEANFRLVPSRNPELCHDSLQGSQSLG